MSRYSLISYFRNIYNGFFKCSRSFFRYLSCQTQPSFNTDSLLSLDEDVNLSEDEDPTLRTAFI